MAMQRKQMIVPKAWFQVAILTFVVGFGVLGFLAYAMYRDKPPVPVQVLDATGRSVFTAADIQAGQHLFQKYGLMELGTVFGHGAYLGPDFTAQYLHHAEDAMAAFYRTAGSSEADAAAAVQRDLKANHYDAATGRLTFSGAQAHAFEAMVNFYGVYFGAVSQQQGLRRPHISDLQEVRQLTAFFAWASWVATATRAGTGYSYTNNWPPDARAGNVMTADAMLWSALSLIALLGGVGIVLFVFGRYHFLGWHRSEFDETQPAQLRFRPPDQVRLTPAQSATPWFFLVVGGLFLLQGLLGGANAHYHVEPAGFYGWDLANWFPYHLTRTWHLQLALFFVATSFLAIGIFLAPMIAGREPPHQRTLALLLFGALVVVVVGSLVGEAANVHNWMSLQAPWYWIGGQGWEFLDLGRLWQILLTVGLVFWVIIIFRGLRPALVGENPGNMPYLFLYSALSIPVFYAAGLAFRQNSSYLEVDFWRFWVVHLWVEDFLELFTTIMVAYIFVLIGVVRPRVAITVIYLDVILYSIGGVIGTMHHLYFSGAPAIHMSLGAFFSAMEVVPLVLLTYEAWRFMRLGGAGPDETTVDTAPGRFPHKWAVMFLIAVGFWNFVGAGIFGFLINLPVVSYYEIGTAFTANHGHGSMMGVYGMLAMAFLMFAARYFIPQDRGSERAMRWSFWGLNLGLAWMLLINLFPLGLVQLYDAVTYGYWHAREPAFFETTAVRVIEWLRLPGDVLFIVMGIGPVVYLAVRMFQNRHRPGELSSAAPTDVFTEPPSATEPVTN